MIPERCKQNSGIIIADLKRGKRNARKKELRADEFKKGLQLNNSLVGARKKVFDLSP